MKRITKTKLLKHLTKLVDDAHGKVSRCEILRLKKARDTWHARYNTLIEIRDFINTHRL